MVLGLRSNECLRTNQQLLESLEESWEQGSAHDYHARKWRGVEAATNIRWVHTRQIPGLSDLDVWCGSGTPDFIYTWRLCFLFGQGLRRLLPRAFSSVRPHLWSIFGLRGGWCNFIVAVMATTKLELRLDICARQHLRKSSGCSRYP